MVVLFDDTPLEWTILVAEVVDFAVLGPTRCWIVAVEGLVRDLERSLVQDCSLEQSDSSTWLLLNIRLIRDPKSP